MPINVTTIHHFSPEPIKADIPTGLENPFNGSPHPLAIRAAGILQGKLSDSPSLSTGLAADGNGKMFGVLVVINSLGELGFLSAFSGMLNQQWLVPGFVPPVFDIEQQAVFLRQGEAELDRLTKSVASLLENPDRLKAGQELSEWHRQSEKQLSALKSRNQENKKVRRTKRQAMEADEFDLLQVLSLSSQQDKKELKQLRSAWQEKLDKARLNFDQNYEEEIESLKLERQLLSQKLHNRVFETYRLKNSLGEVASVRTLFGGKTPPGGTADCAAPKLLQFAFQNNLTPLALAEFWWGGSPADGVRHQGHFYPPCRGKCQPILPFMLKGLDVELSFSPEVDTQLEPEIVYEDEDLIVVNKPAGLLSIPGKQQSHSVLTWLAQRFPGATGSLLVHRLDMATSGLLLAAKNSQAHKNLQKQFLFRTVSKRYVAVLSKAIEPYNRVIDLPLRVDLDDRPRQIVCYEHGKQAVTRVDVISNDNNASRVYFYPLTGRTHQLRVHAAHVQGLAAPIVGDQLYGSRSERMLLHAEVLCFDHPLTGERMTLESEVPF